MGKIPDDLTDQGIFNAVVTHLRKQGKKAEKDLGFTGEPVIGCAYRADDGCECAFGCLIPDNVYRPEMEAKALLLLIEDYLELRLYGRFRTLARTLQQIHDDADVGDWEARWKELAGVAGLVYTPPEAPSV